MAVFVLVRRETSLAVACATAALSLMPLSISVWHLLIRVDGLMHALWLLAAVALLPRRLEVGADRLSWSRLLAGTAFLFASSLAKPTAVLHGAPLVLGWLLVDRGSFARLVVALAVVASAWIGAMQWLTNGGYLWVLRVWGVHAFMPGQIPGILRYFVGRTGALGLFAGAGLFSCALRGGRPLAESAWLLVLGGLMAVPLTGSGLRRDHDGSGVLGLGGELAGGAA